MPDPKRPDLSAPEPVYAPAEIEPPAEEANSFGGGVDAADLPALDGAEGTGPGTAHDDEGWRAIETRP